MLNKINKLKFCTVLVPLVLSSQAVAELHLGSLYKKQKHTPAIVFNKGMILDRSFNQAVKRGAISYQKKPASNLITYN